MLIHYEHFDLYGTDANALLARGYAYPASGPTFNTSSRTGARCIRWSAGSGSRGYIRWALPTALDTVGIGAAVHYEATLIDSAASHGLHFGVSGADRRLRIIANAAGGFNVYINTTLVGSSAPTLITPNSWFWLEAKATRGATTGALEVRLNGAATPIITLTGLALPDQWASVSLGQESTANQAPTRYDDWIVWDTTGDVNNDFMGDTFVLVAPPEADATISDFVPSTGSNRWSLVDEDVPNDADFITGNTVGDAQEFSHSSLNLPVGAVAAIATQVRAFKTDAGSSSIEVGLASGSQTSMGAEVALATSGTVRSHIANLNPNGNIPWTQSAAQAARLRVRRAA